MIEKNFDPDNDHCPEKEMVEHLYKLKQEVNHFEVSQNYEDEKPATYSYSENTIKK